MVNAVLNELRPYHAPTWRADIQVPNRCSVHYRDGWKRDGVPKFLRGDITPPAHRLKCASIEGHLNLKTIWIEPYYRIRAGVIQHVRGHWRRKRGAGSNVVYFTSVA